MKNVSKTGKTIAAFSLLCISITNINAQEMSIGIELRPRAEYRDGYGSPNAENTDPGGFILQRTRLTVGFKNSYLKTGITVQDSRTLGETGTNSEAVSASGSLSVYEAWADVLLCPGGSVVIGRQALKYDDNRIFSASNWSNTGNSHDVVVFKYELEHIGAAHLGLAYNNDKTISKESMYSGATKYRYLGYIWISKPLMPNLSLTALALDEGFQKTSTDANGSSTYGNKVSMYHRYTAGGNIKFLKKDFPLDLFATAYFQFGKTSATKRLNASLLALKANYAFMPQFILTAGADRYSGGGSSNSSKSKTFNWLYGAPHSFNGYMDYWTASLPTQGLLDVYGQVGGSIIKKWGYEVGYHLFKTVKDIEYDGASQGKSLGSEVDIKLSYKMNDCVSVEGGWGSYFLNNNSRFLKLKSSSAACRTPGWAYISLTIKPDMFKIKL
jgi:hypothetical protein